jgi:hypothetical protein
MLMDDYLQEIAVLEIHVGDSYATAWGNSRKTFYANGGTPDAWFDGTLRCYGAYENVTQMYNWYNTQIHNRLAIPAVVTVQPFAEQVSGATWTVTARVCLEAGATGRSTRVHMVQVLDHYPATPTYSRNTVRAGSPIQTITLTPGECQTVSYTFTFDATSWANQSNMKVIVWAQNTLSVGPSEVYQASQIVWPFPGDCNDNNIPDPDDIASGTSLDENGNGIPDECEQLLGDMNCDGTIDVFDLDGFVLALTDPVAYVAAYPDCNWRLGDINQDTLVDVFDIDLFVDLLLGS